jgi:hypothetical protein
MNDLLADPESIPFLKNNSVNLSLLKNEIDRRILKISYLAKRLTKRKKRS